MTNERFVDYRSLYEHALNLPAATVKHGLGADDEAGVLAEVKAANVANQATTQAIIKAVDNARAHGQSWSDIGLALGITKQGAQKRFGEPDEAALIRAIIETRSAGSIVRVPKPIAVLLPAFSWILDGLNAGRFSDASFQPAGSDAFVPVPRDEYLAHHPTAITNRFFLQHLTETGLNGSNWTFYAETEEEVKAKADEVWGPERVEDRQEIIDSDTGVRWIRAGGKSAWSKSAPIDPRAHTRRRGQFIVALHCTTCGTAMTEIEYDENGLLWTRCPKDPTLDS